MKEYYQQRLYWIFHYTKRNFWYCLAKTLCLIVGVPIYAVMFCLEMVLTAINMIFSWIPILNVVVMVVCKALITVVGSTFYICILTDLKEYKNAMSQDIEYEIRNSDVDTQANEDIDKENPDNVESSNDDVSVQ